MASESYTGYMITDTPTRLRTTLKRSDNYALQDRDILLSHAANRHDGQYVLRVKDLPDADKPREKLQELGPGQLSRWLN